MTSRPAPTISNFGRQFLDEYAAYFRRPLDIFRRYQRKDLRPDLLAGLTVAVVMLPQAIAYALIAELPPQAGLYAAIVASIFGVLWGSSSHLHTGPTNAASLLVLSTLLPIFTPGSPEYLAAAGLLAVMVGVARLFMGLARLGMMVNFVADSVVIGFTTGAGILISVGQLRYLFRVEVTTDPVFYNILGQIISRLPETHFPSMMIGAGTILVIVLLQWRAPKWPAALLGMILAATAVALLNLDENGVAVLGKLPRSLPPLARLPLLDLNLIRQMSTGALAIAAIGLVEAMSIARSIASQSGEHIDNNQEFIGQGLANIAAGFFSGYTTSGSFTRSAVNYNAGARTPLAVVFSGIWVMLAVLLLAPLAAFLPRAALAGVLLVTAYKMIDRKEIRRIWETSKGDSMIMAATMIATLLLPLEFAVLTGILVSFVRYIHTTSSPAVHTMLPDEEFRHFTYKPRQPTCPQLAVLTIEGSLYFGATAHVEEEIRHNLDTNPYQRFLLLRMHQVNHCDISGLHMLETIVRLYRQHGGDVFMVGVREAVWEKIRLSHFDELLGLSHFLSQERAVEHIFFKAMDPGICIYNCPHKIWRECQSLPKSDRVTAVPTGVLVPETAVIPNIQPQTLWHSLSSSDEPCPLVIDVREPYEFERGHVPHAQLMPMPQIMNGEITIPTRQKVVLVCRSGRRSTQILYKLQTEQRYHNLSNLDGGMIAWEAAGLPTVID
jgi:SulP family sulfate permease